MGKFINLKKIKNQSTSPKQNQEKDLIRQYIKDGLTRAQIVEKGFSIRRIQRWFQTMGEYYQEGFRKKRTPKSKVDVNELSKTLNFSIDDIKKKKIKIF